MIQLALVACCLLCAVAFWLWDRLARAERGLGLTLWPELERELRGRLEQDLLPGGDARGWSAVDVPWREVHDDFRTADDLMRRLPGMRGWRDLAGFERLVQRLYQLQAALDLPAASVERVLAPECARLQTATFLDRPLGAVEPVAAGALLDREAMRPLNPGTRVRQPLGVVVRDADGRVVSRAKVVCS